MKLSERVRNINMWLQEGGTIHDFADEIEELENELEQLKKDCMPFQAQIDQRKTYKTQDDMET